MRVLRRDLISRADFAIAAPSVPALEKAAARLPAAIHLAWRPLRAAVPRVASEGDMKNALGERTSMRFFKASLQMTQGVGRRRSR